MVRNEDILKDILLKMNYDTSKTLNENKSILSEQSIPVSEYYYDKEGNLHFKGGHDVPDGLFSLSADVLFPKAKGYGDLPQKVSREFWYNNNPYTAKAEFISPEFIQRMKKSNDYLHPETMYKAWLAAKAQFPYWSQKYPSPVINSEMPQEFIDLYTQANPYVKSNYVTYNGSEKPEPPVLFGTYMSSPGYNVRNSDDTSWTLPYKTPNNSVRVGRKGKNYLEWVYEKDLEQWKRNQQRERIHFLIPIASIALSFLGPWGIAAGLALEAYDVKLYVEEDDPLMAGLAIVFAFIPAGQLVRLGLKDTAVMAKSTPAVKQFLNKMKNRLPLNQVEQRVSKEIFKAQSKLNLQIFKNTVRSWVGDLTKLSLRQSLVFLLKLMKYGIIGTKWGIRGVSLLAISYAVGLEAIDIVGGGSKPSPEEIAKASELIKDENGLNQALVGETIALLDELEDDTEKQEKAIRAAEEYNKSVDDILAKIERGEI